MATVAVAVLVLTLAFAPARPAAASPGDVTLQSVLPDGQNAPGYSFLRDVSADGAVLFQGQTAPGSFYGLYLRQAGQTQRVDVNSGGTPAFEQAVLPASITDDGRHVAFLTTSYVFGGTDERIPRLVVRDLQTSTATLIGLVATRTDHQDLCGPVGISNGGGVIAFSTRANLTPADTNTWCDVYAWTAASNTMDLVEGPTPADPTATPSTALLGHRFLSMTPNGRYLLSTSDVGVDAERSTLTYGQTSDLFLTDLETRTRTLESLTNDQQPLGYGADQADLSDDATRIVFTSYSDPNRSCVSCLRSTYLRDRSSGQSTAIATTPYDALASADRPTISGDGLRVAAQVDWLHITTGHQGNYTNMAAYDVATDAWQLASHAVGAPDAEADAQSSNGAISADGATVGFESYATNLIGPAGSAPPLGVYAYEVTGLANPDADGDLIDDVVDADGGTGASPGRFMDGALLGEIRSKPLDMKVYVSDVAAPEGVRVQTTGTLGEATIYVCGNTTKLKANSDIVFNCGSVIARVVLGSIDIVLGDGQTVVTVPAGVTAEVGDVSGGGYFVDVLADAGGVGVTVTNEGVTSTVKLEGGPTPLQAWNFDGFADPVDNGGILNVVKAGKVVPLKWHLTEAGAPVMDLTTARITFVGLECTSGAILDEVEQTVAASSGLQNLGGGDYQLNWKTPGTRGVCGELRLDLADGVLHTALFRLI